MASGSMPTIGSDCPTRQRPATQPSAASLSAGRSLMKCRLRHGRGIRIRRNTSRGVRRGFGKQGVCARGSSFPSRSRRAEATGSERGLEIRARPAQTGAHKARIGDWMSISQPGWVPCSAQNARVEQHLCRTRWALEGLGACVQLEYVLHCGIEPHLRRGVGRGEETLAAIAGPLSARSPISRKTGGLECGTDVA